MALLHLLLLFTLCIISQSQLCSLGNPNGNNECNYPNGICSSTKLCYGRINITDAVSVQFSRSISSGNPPGDLTWSPDPSLILDGDVSTSVSVPGNELGWYTIELDFPGEQGYWIHGITIVYSADQTTQQVYVNGYDTTYPTFKLDTLAAPDDGLFYQNMGVTSQQATLAPFFARNISIVITWGSQFNLHAINFYGLPDTLEPTASPSTSPTGESQSPSKTPTQAPSPEPTPQPTDYPTPDVCDDYVVTQSCCGNYGYIPISDEVNIRDPSLPTCERSFTAPCCGDSANQLRIDGNNVQCIIDGQFMTAQSRNNGDPDMLCLPSYFDTSVNTTDDIVGTVVNGTNILYDTGSLSSDTFAWCQCEFIAYECNGTDDAVCGIEEDYEDLFDLSCWNNETYSPSDLRDLTNDTCWKDNNDDYGYLLYEPCSEESFLGSVTVITGTPSEHILDGECTCDYEIKNCHVLEDRSTIGTCNVEVANPCCTLEFDYEYDNFTTNGTNSTLIATIPSDQLKPLEDGWSCRNGLELCPDLWNNSRKFEIVVEESRVDWWYDNGEFYSVCGCKYIVDECNLPSVDPTMDPTADPTEVPTFEPTESDGDGAFEIKISLTVIIGILSIISLL